MLVISVRPGERIKIGDNVWLMLTRVSGDAAKLGFEAPPDVNIVRESVLLRDQGQGESEGGE